MSGKPTPKNLAPSNEPAPAPSAAERVKLLTDTLQQLAAEFDGIESRRELLLQERERIEQTVRSKIEVLKDFNEWIDFIRVDWLKENSSRVSGFSVHRKAEAFDFHTALNLMLTNKPHGGTLALNAAVALLAEPLKAAVALLAERADWGQVMDAETRARELGRLDSEIEALDREQDALQQALDASGLNLHTEFTDMPPLPPAIAPTPPREPPKIYGAPEHVGEVIYSDPEQDPNRNIIRQPAPSATQAASVLRIGLDESLEALLGVRG